jgi:protein-disulfide isomerase
MFLISYLFGHTLSFQTENDPNTTSLETNRDILSSLNSPIVGAFDAPVTIIAFNDYQCQGCKTWYINEYQKIVKNLIEPKKANLIFVDAIPLGNDSLLASEATYCANEQGKYSEYQELVFNSQQEIDDGWVRSEQLKTFANNLDLDMASFKNCLDSGKYENQVLSNMDYTKKNGVEKIPIFKIINSEGKHHIIKGGTPSSVFENIVDLLTQ